MKKVIYLVLLTLFSRIVYAAPNMDNFLSVFNIGGVFLESLLINEYAVFAITVVIFTILFYNLYVPLVGKIPVFKGEKGPTNKYGKIVGLCMALLSSMGIFGLLFLGGGAVSVKDSLTNILGPYATLAGIMMGFLVFGMVWFGFKESKEGTPWNRALWCAGLTMVFMGYLLSRPPLFALGWVIVALFLLIFMFKGGPFEEGKGGSGDGSGGSGGGSDSDKGKDGKLTGQVLDLAGNLIVTGVNLTAVDASGSPISGATATSLANGSFTIVLKDLTKAQKVAEIRGTVGGNNFSAIYGSTNWGGRAPSYKVKPGKTVDNIVVAQMNGGRGGGGTVNWVYNGCQYTPPGGARRPIGVSGGDMIDSLTGTPLNIAVGGILHINTRVLVGYSFDVGSPHCYIRIIDPSTGATPLTHQFLPVLGTAVGVTLTMSNRIFSYNLVILGGITPGNYNLGLKLDTV